LTAGKWFGDEKQDMGIQTGPDARFYSIYSPLDTPFSNEGKTLVLQVRFMLHDRAYSAELPCVQASSARAY
jgi:hypothetical protein